MRLKAPLPAELYDELRELKIEVDELWRDFEITHPDAVAPLIDRIRGRVSGMILDADRAKQRPKENE